MNSEWNNIRCFAFRRTHNYYKNNFTVSNSGLTCGCSRNFDYTLRNAWSISTLTSENVPAYFFMTFSFNDSSNHGNSSLAKALKRAIRGGFRGGRGCSGRAFPFFCNHLFFCNHFEELQTVLFKVELIINNKPLTYVYPNTIETFYSSNLLYSSNTTSTVIRNLLIR